MEDYRKTIKKKALEHDILYILDMYITDIDTARVLMYEMVPNIISFILWRTNLRMEIETEDIWSEMFMIADKRASSLSWKDKHPNQRKSYFRTLMWRELRQPSNMWMFMTYPTQKNKSHHIPHINSKWGNGMRITDFTSWDPQDIREVEQDWVVTTYPQPDELAETSLMFEQAQVALYNLLEPLDLEIYLKHAFYWMKNKEIADWYDNITPYFVRKSLIASKNIIDENMNNMKESDSEGN